MKERDLLARVRQVCAKSLKPPGAGDTASRHLFLYEAGREDLSLARLVEAHQDAIAVLQEAGRAPEPGAIYGIWAAEGPQARVMLSADGPTGLRLDGTKNFASGAGLVDRALVTVNAPDPWLVDVDLRQQQNRLFMDYSGWRTSAFEMTKTAAVTFDGLRILERDKVGGRGWYLARPGFWHGACGPASCWAGGAAGLLDYARKQSRDDPHTLAHLGAMESAVWSTRAVLQLAGREIDCDPENTSTAHVRALTVRHAIEQRCVEVLERFGRAYGPYPLAFCDETARRHQELTIYLRQCHAERDLEELGKARLFSCSA